MSDEVLKISRDGPVVTMTIDDPTTRNALSPQLRAELVAALAFGAVRMWTFLVVQGLATGVMVLWLVRLGLGRRGGGWLGFGRGGAGTGSWGGRFNRYNRFAHNFDFVSKAAG